MFPGAGGCASDDKMTQWLQRPAVDIPVPWSPRNPSPSPEGVCICIPVQNTTVHCRGARAVRARCQLGVYLGTLPVIIAAAKRPPGKNKKLPQSLWESLATIQKPQEDRWCACGSAFSGVPWAVWVGAILGWCPGADTAQQPPQCVPGMQGMSLYCVPRLSTTSHPLGPFPSFRHRVVSPLCHRGGGGRGGGGGGVAGVPPWRREALPQERERSIAPVAARIAADP